MYVHVHVLYVGPLCAGMSESSGPHSLNLMYRSSWNVGSAGKDMIGVKTKIDQQDADGEGEVSAVVTVIVSE